MGKQTQRLRPGNGAESQPWLVQGARHERETGHHSSTSEARAQGFTQLQQPLARRRV